MALSDWPKGSGDKELWAVEGESSKDTGKNAISIETNIALKYTVQIFILQQIKFWN